jgi:hypothetical protein
MLTRRVPARFTVMGRLSIPCGRAQPGRWHRGEVGAVGREPCSEGAVQAPLGREARQGVAAGPAISALSVHARAFKASLDPRIPALRKARRDTGFPAEASLLAISRARSISDALGAMVPALEC